MKTKRLVFWATAFFLGCGICFRLSAQTSPHASITQGKKGKFYLLSGAMGSRQGFVSPDRKYVTGGFSDGTGSVAGYIYDIGKDTTYITSPAEFFRSMDWYAGGGVIYKDGGLINVESRSGLDPSEYYANVSLWAATPDLTRLMSMSYESVEDPSTGESKYINFAYVIDGNTGKVIEKVEPHWPMTTDPQVGNGGYGERVNGCNSDGTILVGHSSKPGNSTNWSPVFWDRDNDTSFSVGDPTNLSGSLEATNNDGSIIIGTVSGKNTIIRYDKQNLTYTVEYIPFSPGKNYGLLTCMSENGLIVFLQQSSSADPGSRQSYIYNMKDKSVTLMEDYLRELYGIDAPAPCFSASSISDDGRMIAGWSFQGAADVPFLVVLDQDQLFARPRNFQAMQNLNTMEVELQWRAPMAGQYTLKGYDVYCDSIKLNAELIDPSTLHYIQSSDLENGVHEYAVQAVYEEGVSDYTDAFELLVIADGGCLPVQEISSTVTYNRYVDIFWGLPSAQMHESGKAVWDGTLRSGMKGGEGKGKDVPSAKIYRNRNLDLIRYDALEGYSWSSAVVVGNRVYATDYGSNAIVEFDYASMDRIAAYAIDGVNSIYNMVYLNGKFYLATGSEEILIIDGETMTTNNRFRTEEGVKVRHLSYIPELNGGKGGFAYGDWESMYYCNMYGQGIEPENPFDIEGLVISGTAYCNGMLYVFSQSGEKYDELYTLDFSTGEIVGKKDLSEDPRLGKIEPNYGFIAGGLGVSLLPDSTAVLTAMLQFQASTSHLAFLEAESAPGLLGYNLYRNGEKMNPDGQYVEGLSYQDVIYQAGTYAYTVEAVNANGCSEMLDGVKTEVVVAPLGECAAPEKITAYESNRSVRLDWEYANEDGPALVGFNIYRNRELVAENLLDLKFTDFNVEKGNYVYRIQAYHDNSCTASDSVTLEVDHEGAAMAPSALEVKAVAGNGKYEVETRWDLPYFEEPLAVGYCNLPMSGVALNGSNTIYAVIGWDSAKLDLYRDLYLVGVEFFIGEKVDKVTGVVYLNDAPAYSKEQDRRLSENAWNTIMFDRYISMDQPMEVVVGYKAEYEEGASGVAVFDMGPAEPGYGDLLSPDGQQWGTLSASGYDFNWCINALVVKKRDLEAAKTAVAQGGSPMLEVMRLGRMPLTEPRSVRVGKATSQSVKLQGFNVYRDEEKRNSEILKAFSFKESGVAPGTYEYKVSAVYSDQEVESDIYLLDIETVSNREGGESHLHVFPNPARDGFYVQGDYKALDILNMAGVVVSRHSGDGGRIDIGNLAGGTYLLRFELPDGSVCLRKIVVNR